MKRINSKKAKNVIIVEPKQDRRLDRKNIQSAIDQVGPGGRVILVPYKPDGKKYLIDNTIELDSSITLGGENESTMWDNDALPWLQSKMTESPERQPVIQLYSYGILKNVHIEPNLTAPANLRNSGVSIVGSYAQMRNVKIFGTYNGIETGTPIRDEYNGRQYHGGGNGSWTIDKCYVGQTLNRGMLFHRVNSWSYVKNSELWICFLPIELLHSDGLKFDSVKIQGDNHRDITPQCDCAILVKEFEGNYSIADFNDIDFDAYLHAMRVIGYASPDGKRHRISVTMSRSLTTYSFMVYHARGSRMTISTNPRLEGDNESCVRLVGGEGREDFDTDRRGLFFPNQDTMFCTGDWE